MTTMGSTLDGVPQDASTLLDAILAASTEHAIIATDRDGHIIVWNEGATRLLGWSAEDTIGASILDFWAEGRVPTETLAEIGATAERGEVWDGTITGQRNDGSDLTARVTITPMMHTGELDGYLVVARDKAVELEELSQQIRTMLGAIVHDREADRRRVAVEIHDDTIQVMTAVALKLQAAQGAAASSQVADVCAVVGGEIENAIARLRDLMLELHPPRETPVVLRNTLEVVLEEAAAMGHFTGSIRGRPQCVPTQEQLSVIYRIAREALSNCVRHSDATRVKIVVTDHAGGVLVQVRDNGIGFNVAECAEVPGHLGMSGMREHAEAAGGRLEVRSAIGRGATVELWIPVETTDA